MNLRNSLTLINKLIFLLLICNVPYFAIRHVYFVEKGTISDDVSINNSSQDKSKVTTTKKIRKIPFYNKGNTNYKTSISEKAAKIQKVKIKALIKAKKHKKKNKKKQKTNEIKQQFAIPLNGKITKIYGKKPFQDGIEVSSKEKEVKACLDGKVLYSGKQLPEYKTLIIIKHKNNYITVYGYLVSSVVKVGQKVIKNQPIGKIHEKLYLEIRKNKSPTDPTKYLKF